MNSDINVNTSLSRTILETENSEEWLVVTERSNFMPKNHITNRFDPMELLVLNFLANNFRIAMGHLGRSHSKERETNYQ